MEDEDQSGALVDKYMKVIELNLMKCFAIQQSIHLSAQFLSQKSWIGD